MATIKLTWKGRIAMMSQSPRLHFHLLPFHTSGVCQAQTSRSTVETSYCSSSWVTLFLTPQQVLG